MAICLDEFPKFGFDGGSIETQFGIQVQHQREWVTCSRSASLSAECYLHASTSGSPDVSGQIPAEAGRIHTSQFRRRETIDREAGRSPPAI